jgi:hypothetical protein
MRLSDLKTLIMRRHAIASLLLILATFACRADIVISAVNPRVAPGTTVALTLTLTNTTNAPLTFDVPSPLHVRFETKTTVTILDFAPTRVGQLTIEPGRFEVVGLHGRIPAEAEGVAVIAATGFETNSVALQLTAPATTDGLASATPSNTPEQRVRRRRRHSSTNRRHSLCPFMSRSM